MLAISPRVVGQGLPGARAGRRKGFSSSGFQSCGLGDGRGVASGKAVGVFTGAGALKNRASASLRQAALLPRTTSSVKNALLTMATRQTRARGESRLFNDTPTRDEALLSSAGARPLTSTSKSLDGSSPADSDSRLL